MCWRCWPVWQRGVCIRASPHRHTGDWGLRDYKLEPQVWGDWRGHLGLEPTIDLYLDHLLLVFDAVRRVLRDDATLYVNLGDSYNGEGLVNAPHRFALRMQAAGWYLRSTIVWAKGVSFCDSYSGSVMPESLAGTRWELCRVKERSQDPAANAGLYAAGSGNTRMRPGSGGVTGVMPEEYTTDYTPCPGCPKCEPNGGWVLRRGSWRPTSSFEYVFMFAKSARYYSDGEGVREDIVSTPEAIIRAAQGYKNCDGKGTDRGAKESRAGDLGKWSIGEAYAPTGRNLRNVWTINPQPFAKAHFATFPEALVEPLIKCSTSDRGVCPECGAPWARCVETTPEYAAAHKAKSGWSNDADGTGRAARHSKDHPATLPPKSTTLGWRPTCGCVGEWGGSSEANYFTPTPATVLDPFLGSGTTLLVARKLGRNGIGIELSEAYAEMARQRIADYAPLFT